MKFKQDRKNVSDSKESLIEALKDFSLKLAIYVFLAIIVFIASKVFWWIGLILFIAFAVYILVEILVYGFISVIGISTAILALIANLKSNSKSQNNLSKKDYYLLTINLVYGLFCLLLLILACSLFVFLF